ncbi:MAG: ABC transporter ATP-binding protein [Candidatus Pacearchaeota archaeon]|nr:ABC transporter ATP-binding protein [Candidatus Pacearchaeota archaeon]
MAIFWRYLKKHKKILFLALFLAAINQIFSLLDPQILRLLIDNYASKANEISGDLFIKGVVTLLLLFVGVAFVSRIAKNFQDYFVNAATQKFGTDMYADSVKHALSLPYNIFEDRRSGEILQKLQKARTDSQAVIMSSINVLFLSLIGMLFVVIYAFYVHWSIGAAFAILIPLLTTFIFILSKKIKKAQRKIVIESAELAGSTTETLRNIELVKSMGLENQEISRLNNVNSKILKLELNKIKFIRLISFIQGTLVNGVRAGIMFLMFFLLFQQQITLGEFFTLFFYSFFIFSPLGELSTVVSQYQEAKASNEQLHEILKIKIKEKPQNAKEIKSINSISFKNVRFKYEKNNYDSIKDFSASIKPGQTIAFVGPSGSGKTTLIKLILGLYTPQEGSININNIKLTEIDTDLLRRRIGLVAQETQLFAGTLKENLLFVNPKASNEDCLNALKMAKVSHIMDRGKKQLDTKIGEGGIKLSGGEKQRLAIARALLRNPDILIFDEATSSLDSLTEKEITNTIKEITKEKQNLITILVAHRLSTIYHSDKILVLEKGKLIEQGMHSNLIKKKGLYYALWREQIGERKD